MLAPLAKRGCRKVLAQTWQAVWRGCSATLPSSTAATFLAFVTAARTMPSWKALLVCHACSQAARTVGGSQLTARLLRISIVEIMSQHAPATPALMLTTYAARAP